MSDVRCEEEDVRYEVISDVRSDAEEREERETQREES